MNASFQRAQILFQQSRYADAERELREVLAKEHTDAIAHAMLALCLSHRKAFLDASAEADAAAGLAPEMPFAHYARARVLVDRNRFEEAEVAVAEALRLDSFNPLYYALLGSTQLARGRWADALTSAEHGLSVDPEDSGCVNVRASALVHLNRKEEAGAAIGQALARDPHNATTHANQGWALLHRGEHKQALEHFREALRLDPELEWARVGIVEALKARHLIYRIMLRYFLWMSRLGRRAQWGIVIGLYVGVRIISAVLRSSPELEPLLIPFLILYFIFVYLSWAAGPLFDLTLRLNRFGRHALSRKATIASNWIGGSLLAAILSLAAWTFTRRVGLLLAALFFVLMVLSLAAVFRCDRGWPRWVMAAYTAGLALLGGAAIAAVMLAPAAGHPSSELDSAGTLGMAFLFALFAQGWIGNALVSVRVKH